MNTFIRFFYEFISIFFDGVIMIFKGLFEGFKLVKDGIIERVGSTKAGCWKIKK